MTLLRGDKERGVLGKHYASTHINSFARRTRRKGSAAVCFYSLETSILSCGLFER